MALPYFGTTTPVPFAHRGGSKRWPENTLLAFRSAADLGYRYIETDVHETADGHFVCFHDETLERTTNGSGLLKDHTLEQLRTLDAAYRFNLNGGYPYRGRGHQIPTLEEVLSLDRRLRFTLEIKPTTPGLPKRLYEFISHHGVEDEVLVASQNDQVGKAFAAVSNGRIATSPGFYTALNFWARVNLGIARHSSFGFNALQVPPTYRFLRVVTPRFVEAAHHHGIHVHVWTIDDPTEMRDLLAMGVDGIMTDVPDVLLEVMGADAVSKDSP